MNVVNKKQLSTSEVAKLLKISRIAVFKKIKSGELKAEKIGRNYVIQAEDYNSLHNPIKNGKLTEQDKKNIDASVEKAVHEYGETLELLGSEEERQDR